MAVRPGTVQPSGSVKDQLPNIWKLIREAQTLDDNGDELGAYRHYLTSVAFTVQTLSTDIHANQGQGTLSQQQAEQLFKMAKNCLERGESIYLTAKKEQRPLALFRLATPSPTPSPTTNQLDSSTLPANDTAMRQVRSGTLPGRLTGIPPSRASTWPEKLTIGNDKLRSQSVYNKGRGRGNSSDQIDGPGPTPSNQLQPLRPVHHFSYMEEAKLKNRYMMEQYKAHLRQSSSQLLPASYQDAGLSMLRRLEENVSVAKIREQTVKIARKMKERETRLRQEEANKPKRNVALSSLSVDELCDHITTFEHGKSSITSLKARLHSSTSDASVIYNTVNEILSFNDHPLNRVLGECQYNVYMMLQPVGSAIEKAGGLPRLEIRLDNCGMDRKPSEDAESPMYDLPKTHPLESGCIQTPPTSHKIISPPTTVASTTNQEDDAHLLELLGADDDEDDELMAAISGQSSLSHPSAVAAVAGDDTSGDPYDNVLNEKLSRLKASLEKDIEARDDRTCTGNGNMENVKVESPEYQNVGWNRNGKTEIPEYQNVGQYANRKTEPPEYQNVGQNKLQTSIDPSTGVPDSEQSQSYQNTQEFSLKSNESYSLLPHEGAVDLIGSRDHVEGGRNDSLYENAEEIESYLQEHQNWEEEELSHIYEPIDHVFVPSTANNAAAKESTDGGGLSRPRPHPRMQPVVEQLEMEELVIFKNLPTLICRSHLGDESAMTKLADTANEVLKEVVKIIHSAIDKIEECLSHCYPILNSDVNCEICHSVIEASLFPPIQTLLVLVYRCKNYSEEVAMAKNMCQHVNATPKDLSVRRKFWLLSQAHAPYGEAIDELRRVVTFQCPSPKVECLVHMSKRIIQCIDGYYEAQSSSAGKVDTAAVGVDDILPILSYIIIRTGLPQLVSECALMEEFIQDGYMKGEEGFCLTSFLTALRYVSRMSS